MTGQNSTTNKKKIIVISLIIVLAISMIVVGVTTTRKSSTVVQTAKVNLTDVVSIVSGSGKIQPKTQVNITSEVNAEITSIPVKEGDTVERGQILVQMDTLQATKDMESSLYAVNELTAHLEGARIQLEQLQDNYARQKTLHGQKMASEQVFKDSYYAFKSQESTIKALQEQKKSADSRLEKARDILNKTTIKAPMAGVITSVDVEVGEIAQAQTSFTQGKTLMVISDLSAFEVEVEIDETDIADLVIDQKAAIEIDAFPDKVFAGRVTEIGNSATTSGYGSTDQSTNFKVKVILLESNQKIRPGMSATVDITTNEKNDVLALPIQAIVMRNQEDLKDKMTTASAKDKKSGQASDTKASKPKPAQSESSAEVVEEVSEQPGQLDGENKTTETGETADPADSLSEGPHPAVQKNKKNDIKGVFLVKKEIAHFTAVTTGISDQQNIEIISGIKENDEVVTGPFRTLRKLKDGDRVKIEQDDPKKEKSEN